MQTLAIVGAQWGDEGKGKLTDALSAQSDVVVRFQGGNNAGHTLWVNGQKTVLHLIPSGILHPQTSCVIGHGVVFDPEVFVKELNNISTQVKLTPAQLKVSENATLITSYDKILDQARESKTAIGTTQRGIGPAYEGKIARRAIKLKDLLNTEVLSEKLSLLLSEREILFRDYYKVSYPSVNEEVERLLQWKNILAPYLCDTFNFLDEALSKGKKVLYEGAQGILLDIDYGTYPYVTSSNTTLGAIYTGAGCPGQTLQEVIGVCKAYTTRVGNGPFPTEDLSPIGELLRQKGQEFGATTGRPRRCGWLDLPLLKYAIKASGLTSIALTKLDILAGFSSLKVCVAYEYQGKKMTCAYPGLDLAQVKPVYENVPLISKVFSKHNPEESFKGYVGLIEEHLKIPVGIVAFGPDREEILFRKKYF